MTKETAIETLLNAMKGFHGRFKKIYGQVAMRINEDTYLISGGNKLLSGIVEDDLVICDISNGDFAAIFSCRPDINAFIFGCSPDTVEVSNEVASLPTMLEDAAQLAGDSIPVADNSTPNEILIRLDKSDICLIKGIGAVAVGKTAREAVAALHILHKECEAYLHGAMLGGGKELDPDLANKLKTDYAKSYVPTNDSSKQVDYIGFEEEDFDVRNEVIEFGKNLIKDDLVFGTGGNLSRRYGDNEMLITPSSMDYFETHVEDIVRVDINELDYGKQRIPSSDTALHAKMYQFLPGCNAIIHTHSNACSVFAACEAGFAISDPNLQQLIGDVKVVPYTPDDPRATLVNTLAVLSDTHAAILPHHGAIFYGPSLEMVYEIAKSVEMIARNLLQYDAKTDDEEETNER